MAAQHRTMIEAVENHMPEVVVVDEIGTEAEALAARSIAQRGVQLVATAHGGELARLIKNPTLSDLIGGIQTCARSGTARPRASPAQGRGSEGCLVSGSCVTITTVLPTSAWEQHRPKRRLQATRLVCAAAGKR